MESYPLYELNPSLKDVKNICFRLGLREKYAYYLLEELRKYNLGFGKVAVLAYLYATDPKRKTEVIALSKELKISWRELLRAEREVRKRIEIHQLLREVDICPRCFSTDVVSWSRGRKKCKSCGRTFSEKALNRKLAWRIYVTKVGTLRSEEKTVEEVAKELHVSKKTVVKYLKIIKKLYGFRLGHV